MSPDAHWTRNMVRFESPELSTLHADPEKIAGPLNRSAGSGREPARVVADRGLPSRVSPLERPARRCPSPEVFPCIAN